MATSATSYYEVRWRPTGADQAWSDPQRTKVNKKIVVEGLTRGQNYDFEVRAVSNCGAKSEWVPSNYEVPTPPLTSTPGTVSGTGVPDGVTLNWGDDVSGIQGGVSYQIERATSLNGPWTIIATVQGNTYTDVLADTNKYYYQIRTIDYKGHAGPWVILSTPVSASISTNELAQQTAQQFIEVQQATDQLNTDVGTVQTDVNNAVASITQEVTDRQAGDSTNASAITAEATARAAAITQEQTDRAAAVQAQAAALAQEVSDRTAAITAEATARQQAIDAQASAQSEALAQEAQARGAAITAEQTARQDADQSLSDTISTNTAAIGANTSAIQTEQTARATADNAEANSRSLLAAQLVGDYTGTDLAQVTSGLIAAERDARVTQDESIVTQMALLSAGVGESFDYSQIWYFTDGNDGWTSNGGVTTLLPWAASWVAEDYNNPSNGYLFSPVVNFNGDEYQQARMRVRQVGARTWNAKIDYQTTDGTWHVGAAIPEPAWDDNQIGVVTVSPAFAGTVQRFRITLGGPGATESDHYEMDWMAAGRPAPGASSAALSQEATARATADTAEVTSRQQLSVALTGLTDPSGTPLANLPNGLLVDERDARVTADESQLTAITALQSTVGQNTSAITTESTTRATADDALGDRIDAVTATAGANTSAITAEATARATGDAANAQQIGQMQSQSGFIFRDVFDEADPTTRWTRMAGALSASTVVASDDSTMGGSVWQIGDNTTDNHAFLVPTDRIPFDPNKLYRVRCRLCRVQGDLPTYLGVAGFTADKTTPVNESNAHALSPAHYATFSPTLGQFVEYVGYIKGHGATIGIAPFGKTFDNPGVMAPDVRYFAPVIYSLYSSGIGTVQIDYFVIEDADALGQAFTAQAQVATEATTRASADSALSSQLTSLTTTVNGKADQSTVDSLSSTVTQQGDTLTSQGTSITNLQSSLDTTNDNVTTAQTAADNAATAAATAAGIANGKGKVLIQSTAPAAADQLAQNLWIDTTGNANTPKRWSGSAWVAVTDKTATDAAAAAAAAQAAASAAQQAANTNAGAISSMQSTVTQQGNTITAQGQSITALQGTVGQNSSAITDEQTARADGDSANTSAINSLSSSFSNSKTDAGSLLPDYKMADPTAWTSYYGASVDLTPNFITVTDGQISNTVAHHTTGYFFNYSKTMLPMVAGESYVISGWWRASTDANGINGFNWRYYNADGSLNSTAGGYGSSSIVVPKTNTWTQFSVKYNADTALANGIAFVEFGFNTNHTGTAGYAETQGMRVVKVIKSTDTDTSIATSASVTSEATTRAAADGALSTQLNTVQATANAAATQASLTAEQTARANADSALGSRTTTIEARMPSGSGALSTAADTSAAQTAAQNAMTAAGAKGKVIYGSTAPAVADQLTQNLWIDTTGNANTPKRWSGSAWVAVTDAVATNAAAAAAAAQSQATANAQAITQTNAAVSTQGGQITAVVNDVALLGAHNAGKSAFVLNQNTVQVDGSTTFAQMLTGINATASANTSAASAAQTSATNAANAAAAASGIANGKADVLIQSTAPSAAMQKATTLWIDTTGNTNTPKRWSGSAWVAVTDKAATDAASAAAAAQATANAAQTAATQAQANINTEATTRANADTALGQRIDSVNATVGANTAAISTEQTARADGDSANASAITAVQAGMVASGENLFPDTDSTLNGYTYWSRNNASMPAAASATDTYGHYVRMLTGGISGAVGIFTDPSAYSYAASPGPYAFGIDIWDAGAPAGSVTATMDFYSATGYLSSIVATDNNPSATYHRITATGVAPAGTVKYLFSVVASDGTQVSEVDFKRIKVERGTVATAYSPDTTSIANASAVQQLTAGTTIGGAAYAAATVMVDANGHIGGTRLASDGTTSSFVVVADQFGVVSPAGTGQRTEYSNGNWRVYDSAGTLRVALGVNI